MTQTAARWFAWAVLIYWAIAAYPPPPGPLGVGLDPSWTWGLNMARAQGLVFGRDVLFTYGPLAWLDYPAPALTGPASSLAYAFVLHALWVFALVRLYLAPLPRGFAVCLVSALGVSTMAVGQVHRLESTVWAVAAAGLAHRRSHYPETLLLGLAAGFAPLVKLNIAVQAAAMFSWKLFLLAWDSRPWSRAQALRLLRLAMIPPAAFLVLFSIVARGDLGAIPAYLRASVELVRGYSHAMSAGGPLWSFGLACLAVLSLLAGLPVLAERRRALLWGWPPAAVVAFFAFKEAIVRQDEHVLSVHIKLLAGAVMLGIAAASLFDRKLVLAFMVLTTGAWFIVNAEMRSRGLPLTLNAAALGLARYSAGTYADPQYWPRMEALDRRSLTDLRLAPAFSSIIGGASVDTAPWDVATVYANGWHWRPAPVFQTYCAYTPYLDRLNADHMRGEKAADYLLLHWNTIDGRHIFAETPLYWQSVLDRYDLVLQRGDRLLLRRNDGSRLRVTAPGEPASVGWNEEIHVPEFDPQSLSFLSAEIRPGMLGRLNSLLVRTPVVRLRVRYATGGESRYRIVPENMNSGALVSHMPRTLEEMAAVLRSGGRTQRVASLAFETDQPQMFCGRIPVRWSHGTYTPSPAVSFLLKPPPRLSLKPLWLPSNGTPQVNGADASITREGLRLLVRSIDSQVYFNLPPEAGSFETLVVRMRASAADRLDLFFGSQVGGRGLAGLLTQTGRWVDVVIPIGSNPLWRAEHGHAIRFDPGSEAMAGGTVEIAGVWSSSDSVPGLTGIEPFQAAAEPAAAPSPRRTGTR